MKKQNLNWTYIDVIIIKCYNNFNYNNSKKIMIIFLWIHNNEYFF